jgi:pSer/pThr/pTyr-binding forkhead associated (FHA) protein
VITLDKERVTLGRGHESDVRINDISVSRTHASLFFESGKIYIRDLKSKFGTLVLIKKQVQIREKVLKVQIGRTCIEAYLLAYSEYEKAKKFR